MLRKKIHDASADKENGSGSFSGSTAIFLMVPVPVPILKFKKKAVPVRFSVPFFRNRRTLGTLLLLYQ
jgi:hypothetical protein